MAKLTIVEELKVADVIAYVGRELASYGYVEDLKQFILDQSIDGSCFVSLNDEQLKDWGMKAGARREKLLALVKRTMFSWQEPHPLLDTEGLKWDYQSDPYLYRTLR